MIFLQNRLTGSTIFLNQIVKKQFLEPTLRKTNF